MKSTKASTGQGATGCKDGSALEGNKAQGRPGQCMVKVALAVVRAEDHLRAREEDASKAIHRQQCLNRDGTTI